MRGGALVAWVDQGSKDVFVNGVNVSRSPRTFSWLPRLAVQGERVHVLWQEIIFSGGSHGGDMLYARSGDGGKTFSAPVNLSESVEGDGKGRITRDYWHNGSFDLALGPGGAVYVAWTEYEGRLWLRRSPDEGRSFLDRQHLAGSDTAPARGPSLAVRGEDVHLAWTDGDVRLASSADGGASFGAPQRLTTSRGYTDAPKSALSAGGTLHLVYEENRQIMYAREPALRQARPITGSGAGFPQLALDDANRVYVTYELLPRRNARPHGLGITVSRDGGVTFTSPEAIPGSADPGGAPNGSFQGLLMQKLAVSGDGTVAVVNSSLSQGRGSRVWLIRGG